MNNGNFDLSKPQFDIFSLRSILHPTRRFVEIFITEPIQVITNQPLHYRILSVTLFSFPTLSKAVASTAGGFGAVALFFNECNNRLKQLMRIEKELNAEWGFYSVHFQVVPLSSKNLKKNLNADDQSSVK